MEETMQQPPKKTGKIIAIVTAAVVGLCAAGVGAGVALASQDDTIRPNVRVMDLSMSGLTQAQAQDYLERERDALLSRHSVVLTLDGEEEMRVPLSELGAEMDSARIAATAYSAGRTGSTVLDGVRYLELLVGVRKYAVNPHWQGDDAAIIRAAHAAADEMDRAVQDFDWATGEDCLYVTMASDGRRLRQSEVVQGIKQSLSREDLPSVDCPYETIAAKGGTVEQLHSEIVRDKSEPYYDKEKDEVFGGEVGIQFDLARAQQQESAARPGDTICISAEIDPPAITHEQMQQLLFRDVLGTYTTRVGGVAGRHKNVKLTAERIDGYVMNSGESIKYGELTTPFSLDNGYFLAPMYLKGKTVDGAGGGACQASSTLYAAALLANLEIVQRINHGFASDYIGLGLDATVAEGGPELEIRNNTAYPIRVQAIFETKNGRDYVTVNLLGTKTDDTYVKIRTVVVSTTPFEEEIVETTELAPGERVVEQTAYTGYLVKTYRQLYSGDGKLISETPEATNKYNARNRIVKVGVAEPSAAPQEGEEAVDPALAPSEVILPIPEAVDPASLVTELT